ncbi:MAG TPA: fibronectin type III domain-containing protein [Candidatus Limnocylindrales bacterium]|nr:fibronectin type III domain-containing protein [Candidatus Limnocylindrales bacterium]
MSFWDGTRWVDERPTVAVRRPGTVVARLTTVAVAVITAAAVFLPLVPFAATHAAGPTLTLTPASAPAGATVRVAGDQFPERARVQLTWDGSSVGMPSASANRHGIFATSFIVPKTAAGAHTLAAISQPTTRKGTKTTFAAIVLATASFTVATGAAPSPSPTPTTPPTPGPTAAPSQTSTPAPTVAPTSSRTPAPTAALLSISAIGVTGIGQSTATITWTVSAAATGQVRYGTTTSYGSVSSPETSFNYSTHVQGLSGLSAGTVYHFAVTSTDAAGHTATSTDRTFQTLTSTATAAPSATPAPTAAPTSTPAPTAAPSTTGVVCDATFGAPTGSDQSSAISSFLASNTGRRVCFATNAVYDVEARITLSGWSGTIYGRGATFRRASNSAAYEQLRFVQGRDIVVDGLNVTGPATLYDIQTRVYGSGDQEDEHAFGLESVSGFTLRNATLTGQWGDGVYVRSVNSSTNNSPSANVVLSNVRMTTIGRNCVSVISAQAMSVNGVRCSNVSLHGFDAEPNRSTDIVNQITITGSDWRTFDAGHTPSGVGYAIVLTPGYANTLPANITITNNTMDVARVRVDGYDSSNTASNVTLTGNRPSSSGTAWLTHVRGYTFADNGLMSASLTDTR